jgi:hypothetical protein
MQHPPALILSPLVASARNVSIHNTRSTGNIRSSVLDVVIISDANIRFHIIRVIVPSRLLAPNYLLTAEITIGSGGMQSDALNELDIHFLTVLSTAISALGSPHFF